MSHSTNIGFNRRPELFWHSGPVSPRTWRPRGGECEGLWFGSSLFQSRALGVAHEAADSFKFDTPAPDLSLMTAICSGVFGAWAS